MSAARLAPAAWPRTRRDDTRMMVVDGARGAISHGAVTDLPRHLRAGDALVLNDAGTLPASLPARTAAGEVIELRLAAPGDDALTWDAVLFGEGDWRTRTERRAPPPAIARGATLRVADALDARVIAVSTQSPRLVTLRFEGGPERFWRAVFAHGRPVQYAHLRAALPLWHAQTAYAGRPWSAEMPSAGRPLDGRLLGALRAQGVVITGLTHAAGLSATGDPALDAALPLPERYEIPAGAVEDLSQVRARGGRVVAVGTSVVRALEGCVATHGALRPGEGRTALRVDGAHTPREVDAVLSGLHEPGTSHVALLSAFAPPALLDRATREGAARGYLGHEFGDACLVLGPRFTNLPGR